MYSVSKKYIDQVQDELWFQEMGWNEMGYAVGVSVISCSSNAAIAWGRDHWAECYSLSSTEIDLSNYFIDFDFVSWKGSFPHKLFKEEGLSISANNHIRETIRFYDMHHVKFSGLKSLALAIWEVFWHGSIFSMKASHLLVSHWWGILVKLVIHPFWGSIFEFSWSNYLYGVSSTGSDPHPWKN